jgi:hypothetical protein
MTTPQAPTTEQQSAAGYALITMCIGGGQGIAAVFEPMKKHRITGTRREVRTKVTDEQS